MTLGEIIKSFRNEHDLSQREFAKMCGVSFGYISMLESGKNPRSDKPLVPALTVLNKLAIGMGITIDELIDAADDMDVTLATPREIGQSSMTITFPKDISDSLFAIPSHLYKEQINNVAQNVAREIINGNNSFSIEKPPYDVLSEGERELLSLFRRIPLDHQPIVLAMIRAALDKK